MRAIDPNQSYIRVAAAAPNIEVADCMSNREQICEIIHQAYDNKVKLLVLPELCITGYTCGDLFLQDLLVQAAKEEVISLLSEVQGKDMLVVVGFPFEWNGCLYNAVAVLFEGEVLGIVPKEHISNYSECSEARYFCQGITKPEFVEFNGKTIPFGTDLLFSCTNRQGLIVGIEIGRDLYHPCPPSIRHALSGATIIANLAASSEEAGKDMYQTNLVNGQSAHLVCGYIFANAGEGESTTDMVFGGHHIISENGTILSESTRFHNQMITADVDIEQIISERKKSSAFHTSVAGYQIIPFTYQEQRGDDKLHRAISSTPFILTDSIERNKRSEEILSIQTMGLKKRLEHTKSKHVVLGISGGLDSTLALLVTVRAFDSLSKPREDIIAVTMPCFGTSDRTYHNALTLTKSLNVSLLEINMKESILQHFKEIGQDKDNHDLTYENAQARERTQILMDIAGMKGGFVVGTGDLSELVLGWATYNGDHMSMYGVNASVPKTLIRYLVEYYADTSESQELKAVLKDILDTPVSPELLPPENGSIVQKTEDIVGPYELHDFYLYHCLRFGSSPAKIYHMACTAFAGQYESDIIKKWLQVFYRRFFGQQFKRSCLPDGPKVGSVSISPRGGLLMPSDASARMWLDEVEQLI